MNPTQFNQSNFHKAETRGFFDFGWLKTYHTFSFGSYYDPERVHFGALRVFNDDRIEAGMGFGTHPHDNMEIVTIPWLGRIAHKDSMGNIEEIKKGEVQIMSAGTGITHSEFNASKTEPAGIFQIWVLPKKRGIQPRYGQKVFPVSERENQFQLVVSPNGDDAAEKGPVWINQDAYFSLGNFTKDSKIEYRKYIPTNLVYTFVIKGSIFSEDLELNSRDGYGTESANHNWIAKEDSELLIIEVPSLAS